MSKILEYLRYPSTWKGIVTILTMVLAFFNIDIDPETAAKIATGGLTLVGVIGTFYSDADVTDKKSE